MKLFIKNTLLGMAFVAFASSNQAFAGDNLRLPVQLEVKEFNSLASAYLPRPTFVEIEEKKKSDRLFIKVDFIRKGPTKQISGGLDRIGFSEKRIDKYIDAIDKYLKWEAVARSDGDIFDKKIAKVSGHKAAYNFFSFHSANAASHYLIIHAPDTSLSGALAASDVRNRRNEAPDFAFDRENATAFKDILTNWKNGEFEARLNVNIEDKYK